MSANPLQWFPFDPSRLLESREARRVLTTAERYGIILLLLIDQWERGPIPDDPEWLKQITHGAPLNEIRAVLQACFKLATSSASSSGNWAHEELEEIRAEKEARGAWYRERASKGGRARALKAAQNLKNDAISEASSELQASYKPAYSQLNSARRGEEIVVSNTSPDSSNSPGESAERGSEPELEAQLEAEPDGYDYPVQDYLDAIVPLSPLTGQKLEAAVLQVRKIIRNQPRVGPNLADLTSDDVHRRVAECLGLEFH